MGQRYLTLYIKNMTTSYHIKKDIGPQYRTMYHNKAKQIKFQQSLETEQCFVSEVKDFLGF